ncbi:unnamed protein product [Gongylonema pulchrum]|uniref:Activin_recp domain-containing protein n=1 Tax=Gongylonema pulchrum TaxID=637853 RepID=A0A183DTS5_9BILA|nr:unnamed protein product [Gongylonema pulchrum]
MWRVLVLSKELYCYSGVNAKQSVSACDSHTEFCYKQVMPNGIIVTDCDRSAEYGFCKSGKEGCEQKELKGKVCCCKKPYCNKGVQNRMQRFAAALLVLIASERSRLI